MRPVAFAHGRHVSERTGLNSWLCTFGGPQDGPHRGRHQAHPRWMALPSVNAKARSDQTKPEVFTCDDLKDESFLWVSLVSF